MGEQAAGVERSGHHSHQGDTRMISHSRGRPPFAIIGNSPAPRPSVAGAAADVGISGLGDDANAAENYYHHDPEEQHDGSELEVGEEVCACCCSCVSFSMIKNWFVPPCFPANTCCPQQLVPLH
jgi:hypothetical protein